MMNYFVDLPDHGKFGPCSAEELLRLYSDHRITDATRVYEFDDLIGRPFREWVRDPDPGQRMGRGESNESETGATSGLASGVSHDLRALQPHLFVPWDQLRERRWLDNRKLLLVAAIGLSPLVFISLLGGQPDVRPAYWSIAYYFSGLWAVFFYSVFPAPRVTLWICLLCFFGTGLLSVTALVGIYALPPFQEMVGWVQSWQLSVRWFGFVLAVGLPEELVKILVLGMYLWARRASPAHPQQALFYGLISGLGFGIYEGVDYQKWRNWVFAEGNAGEYYLLNVLRLTTLPFLHAIWSGIAGYFVGFAFLYPKRRIGFLLVAIGIPAVLHGSYNALGASFGGIGVALLSVLSLNLYLAKSQDFERLFDADHTRSNSGTS